MIEPAHEHLPLLDRALRTVKTRRWWALIPVPVVVLLFNALALPDGFREIFGWLVWLSRLTMLAALTHGLRRLMFPQSDFSAAWAEAMKGNVAAAINVAAMMLLFALSFLAIVLFARA